MYDLLGYAALVGAATVLVTNQLSLELAKVTKPAVLRLQQARDARAALTGELAATARQWKLRGWGPGMGAGVAEARAVELKHLVRTRFWTARESSLGARRGAAFVWSDLSTHRGRSCSKSYHRGSITPAPAGRACPRPWP